VTPIVYLNYQYRRSVNILKQKITVTKWLRWSLITVDDIQIAGRRNRYSLKFDHLEEHTVVLLF